MLKHVICTSQDDESNSPAWKNWSVISIADSGAQDAKLQFGWLHILHLNFDDIEYEDGEHLLFDEMHARSILEFVEQCNDENVEGILVHCREGFSRSGAVAKWICQKVGLSFPVHFDRYNKHVYTVLGQVQIVL